MMVISPTLTKDQHKDLRTNLIIWVIRQFH